MRALRIALALTVFGCGIAQAAPGQKLIDDGSQFNLTTAGEVVLCSTDNTRCTTPKAFPVGVQWCTPWNFPPIAAGTGALACYAWVTAPVVSVPVAPLPMAQKPWPLNPANTQPFYSLTCWPCVNPGYAVAWHYKTSTGWASKGVYGYALDLPAKWWDALAALKDEAKFDALWTANSNTSADPILQALFDKLAADTKPVVTYWVQPIASGTRPYGTPNSTSTGIVKKGDVAVKVSCDGSKRIGNTNYLWVPSVNGYALCQPVP